MFHPTAHGYFFYWTWIWDVHDAGCSNWSMAFVLLLEHLSSETERCEDDTVPGRKWLRNFRDISTSRTRDEKRFFIGVTCNPGQGGVFFFCVCVDFPLFLPNLFFTSSYPPARYQPGRVSPLQTAAHAKSQSSIAQLLALFHIHVLIDNHNWLMPPSLPPSPQKIHTTVHFAPLDSRPRIAVA